MNPMTKPALRTLALLGWVLFYSHGGREWRPVGEFPYETTCEQVLGAKVSDEAQGEIGGALAGQPADNPMRQDAFRKAERRVRDRYRCEYQRG